MDLGDIVSDASGQRFVVGRLHEDGTCLLLNRTHPGVTVLRSTAEYLVEANPYRDWPLLVLPPRLSRWGVLNQVGVPSSTEEFQELVELKDWLLGHPQRRGGALYLSPKLGLRYRDRVLLVFAKSRTSVPIPFVFESVANRKVVAAIQRMPRAEDTSFYGHLMRNDEGDDEA